MSDTYESPRAYAATLGLAKPNTRGRMSAEAHAAISEARGRGVTFTSETAEAKPVKPKSDKPKVVAAPKPERPKVDTSTVDGKAVRAWAAEQGKQVSARGRLNHDLVAEYLASVKPADRPEPKTNEFGGPDRPMLVAPSAQFESFINGKRVLTNTTQVCRDSGVSIGYCTKSLDTHTTVRPDGNGDMVVKRVR